MALFTIGRINEALIELRNAFLEHNYKYCFELLERIFSEIYPLIKEKERKEGKEREKEIQELIGKSIVWNAKDKSYVFTPVAGLATKLRDWDRTLREYMVKCKVYMKLADQTLAAAKV